MVSSGDVIIFYLHIFLFKAFAACYWPNGKDVNEELQRTDYHPCNDEGESMCCALNRYFPDKCRSEAQGGMARWLYGSHLEKPQMPQALYARTM